MKKMTNESLGAVHTHTHTHTHTGSLKENKKKNIKGITLVALVVTIIILLILAGISISVLTQTGLFGKAKQAEQKSKDAQELENETLGDYENVINKYVSNRLNESKSINYKNLNISVDEENANLVFSYNDKKILPIFWYGFEPSLIETLSTWYETGATASIERKKNNIILNRSWSGTSYPYAGITTSISIDLSEYNEFHLVLNSSASQIYPQYLIHTGAFGTDWVNCDTNYITTLDKVTNGPKEYVIDISQINGKYYIGFSTKENTGLYDIAAWWLE